MYSLLYTHVLNQHMYICKYVESHIIFIIIHQRVLVSSVTSIRVSRNKNTVIMRTVVQKYVKKLLDITL